MTKNIIVLFLFLFLSIEGLAHDHVPTSAPRNDTLKHEVVLSASKKNGDWSTFFIFENASNDSTDLMNSLTLAQYYRVTRAFKVGLFYTYQQGAIHSDDWIVKVAPDNWVWRKTGSRSENLFGIDLTYRWLVGSSWVADFKQRLFRNYYNNHNYWMLRPGITYFWFKEGKPFLNIYAQYKYYYPLNFHLHKKYMEWIYLGALYHYNANLLPGVFISFKRSTWLTTADNFEILFPDETYLVAEDDLILGLRLHVNL